MCKNLFISKIIVVAMIFKYCKVFRYLNYSICMGLIHTNHYLDFPSDDWKQISSNPTVFEAIVDNAVIELRDTGHKEQKIVFKNGGQIKYIRSIGKYRLSWDDEDLVS